MSTVLNLFMYITSANRILQACVRNPRSMVFEILMLTSQNKEITHHEVSDFIKSYLNFTFLDFCVKFGTVECQDLSSIIEDLFKSELITHCFLLYHSTTIRTIFNHRATMHEHGDM